jgi:hypothetical protein
MSRSDTRAIERIVDENKQLLIGAWNDYVGR